MNISMPDSLKAFVDERVRSGGYGSYSEYLRELVRRDEQQAAAERLRALIAEGLNSPQGRDWRDLKADLLKQAAAQG
jgi:antitoxin ParD1/3/4